MRLRPHSKNYIQFPNSRPRLSWANLWKSSSHARSSPRGGVGRPSRVSFGFSSNVLVLRNGETLPEWYDINGGLLFDSGEVLP
jgi:hypothetical protein